jgi:hypothetical protein
MLQAARSGLDFNFKKGDPIQIRQLVETCQPFG